MADAAPPAAGPVPPPPGRSDRWSEASAGDVAWPAPGSERAAPPPPPGHGAAPPPPGHGAAPPPPPPPEAGVAATAGATPSPGSKGLRTGVVVAAMVGLLVLVGGGFAMAAIVGADQVASDPGGQDDMAIGDSGDDSSQAGSTAGPTAAATVGVPDVPPGTDADLDALWESCAVGDMASCDDLYLASELDSAYEAFALTCGGLSDEPVMSCGVEFGTADDETTDRDDTTAEDETTAEASEFAPPGTDQAMDVLWTDCNERDWIACDRLFFESPVGSSYETHGATCGGRQLIGARDLCQNLHGEDGDPAVVTTASLEAGMCLETPADEDLIFWFVTRPCDELHDIEVISNVILPDGDYPGEFDDEVVDHCLPAFDQFVGMAYEQSVLDVYHLVPTKDGWGLGDRVLTCGVYDPGGQVTATLAGAAR